MSHDLSLLPDSYEAPVAQGIVDLAECSTGTNVAGDCKCGGNTGGHDCSTGIVQL